MVNGFWGEEQYSRNYFWQDKVLSRDDKQNNCLREIKQSIELHNCPSCWNRGQVKMVTSGTTNCLILLGRLTNYYFDLDIAEAEVKAWADLISETISDRAIELKYIKSKIFADNDFFSTSITHEAIIFESGLSVPVFSFSAESKDSQIADIDECDLFPRRYLKRKFAEHEQRLWSQIWLDCCTKKTDF